MSDSLTPPMNSPPQAPVFETHFSAGKVDTRLVVPSSGVDDGVYQYEVLIPESMTGQQLALLFGIEITGSTDTTTLAGAAQLAKQVHDAIVQMCTSEYDPKKLWQNIDQYMKAIP